MYNDEMTHIAYLWLDNTESDYNYIISEYKRGISISEIADYYQDLCNDSSADLLGSTMLDDLLGRAINSVDWYTVISDIVEGVERDV